MCWKCGAPSRTRAGNFNARDSDWLPRNRCLNNHACTTVPLVVGACASTAKMARHASAIVTLMVLGSAYASNMNGNYLVTRTDEVISDYNTDFSSKGHEYFDIYTPPIITQYGQVYWTMQDPVPLPEDIVARFAEGVIAITGYEVSAARSVMRRAKRGGTHLTCSHADAFSRNNRWTKSSQAAWATEATTFQFQSTAHVRVTKGRSKFNGCRLVRSLKVCNVAAVLLPARQPPLRSLAHGRGRGDG